MERRIAFATLCAVVALRWLGLGLLPLADPSEARYASIAQEMLRSGDWLTPRFPDGAPFLAKPPLHFWLTAISFRVFGAGELAARLPSALAALVLLGATFALGRRSSGARTGIFAALIAATSVLGLGYSALALTDMTLAACVAVALTAFARACVVDADAEPSRGAGLLFFAALGLAMLAKGPVGVAIAAVAIGGWSASQRDLSWARRLPWASGLLLFAAICAPWYVAAERATPGFLRYFFLNENLLRFLTADYGDLYGGPHERPYGYVWGLAFVGMLPWSLLLIPLALLWFSRRDRLRPATPLERFVCAWALAAPLFFTLSRGVVLSYLLPSLPALALGFARAVRGLGAEALRPTLCSAVVATCLALCATAAALWRPLGLDASDVLWLGALLPAAGLIALWQTARTPALVLSLVALVWAGGDLAIRAAVSDELEVEASTAHLAREIERRDDLASCEVLFFGRRPYSAWFYFSRPTDALRKATARLEARLASESCHVVVFREKELVRFDVRAFPEQVYEQGPYVAFVDRGRGERSTLIASPNGHDAPMAR